MSFQRFESGPATKAIAITPSDSADFPAPDTYTKGLYVGGDGDVKVLLVEDTTAVTFVGMKAGSVYPLKIKRVYSTGTTATNLIALF